MELLLTLNQPIKALTVDFTDTGLHENASVVKHCSGKHKHLQFFVYVVERLHD